MYVPKGIENVFLRSASSVYQTQHLRVQHAHAPKTDADADTDADTDSDAPAERAAFTGPFLAALNFGIPRSRHAALRGDSRVPHPREVLRSFAWHHVGPRPLLPRCTSPRALTSPGLHVARGLPGLADSCFLSNAHQLCLQPPGGELPQLDAGCPPCASGSVWRGGGEVSGPAASTW